MLPIILESCTPSALRCLVENKAENVYKCLFSDYILVPHIKYLETTELREKYYALRQRFQKVKEADLMIAKQVNERLEKAESEIAEKMGTKSLEPVFREPALLWENYSGLFNGRFSMDIERIEQEG